MIPKLAPQEKRTGVSLSRGIAPALVLCFVLCGRSPAAILIPASPTAAGRIDYQTVVVQPSADGTKARITIFCALRLRDPGAEGVNARLLVPVESAPESAVAQALAQDRFDRTVTHDLEGAFYRRARMTQRGRACLCSVIGASGGLPAWLLLAPRWPPRAPPLTAVVRAPAERDIELPTVSRARIVPAAEQIRLAAGRLAPRTLEELRAYREGYVIVVEFSAPSESETSFREIARTGIRVSYETTVPTGESAPPLRLPTLTTHPPALTRIYVAGRRGQAAALEGIRFDRDAPSAQKLADDAAAGFARPDFARLSSVRTADGGPIRRAVVRGRNLPDVGVRFEESGVGALRAIGTRVGSALCSLLWPLTAVAYLVALWLSIHAYLWLVSSPLPPGWPRFYLLLVAFGPLLTPWFLLRCLLRPRPPDDGDRSGALGSLSMETYDCVARLAAWALVVCSTWLAVRTLAGLAARLRFG